MIGEESGAEPSRAPQQRSDRASRPQAEFLRQRAQKREQQKSDNYALELQTLSLEQRVQRVEECVRSSNDDPKQLLDSIVSDSNLTKGDSWKAGLPQRLMAAAAQQPHKSTWSKFAHHLAGDVARSKEDLDPATAADALSHFSRYPEDRNCQAACAKLFENIRSQTDGLKTADVAVVAKVLGNLHSLPPRSGADDPARQCLQRVQGLLEQDPNLTSVSSEQLSQLCQNMTVLFTSPDYIQHKRDALDLMAGGLLKAAEHKFNAEPITAETAEPSAKLMRTMQRASRELGDGSGQDNQTNRQAQLKRDELQRFLLQSRKRLDELGPALDPHLSRMLDSADPARALDVHVMNNASSLRERAAPSVFESKFDAMWRQGQMAAVPKDDASGVIKEVTLDHLGKELKVAEQPRYSPFVDLSERECVRVQLPPGELSADVLTRTVPYQGEEYRIDAFAGNAAKQAAPPLWGQDSSAEPPSNGVVWAVPVQETAPGAGFADMTAKLLPSRQHFFYAERAGFPGAPHGPSTVESEQTPQQEPAAHDPTAHVLKGRMRVAYVADETQHPFKITPPGGQDVQLRAYDGHGFIKRSVASRMRAYNDNPGILLGDKKEGGRIPSQCLQHYPNKKEVVDEVVEAMADSLKQQQSREISADQLHRCLTSGNLQTRVGVAVPSANDNLYLGDAESRGTSPGENATLYLRSPYIDQSIRVAQPERVKGQQDATAQYLSSTKTIQYTLLTQTRLEADDRQSMDELDRPGAAPPDPDEFFYSFHKGLYTVVDDEDWPKEFADVSIVMPCGDRKTHSKSPDEKLPPTDGARAEMAGILVATNIYQGRSLVAVPTQPWKDSGGDFDGDTVNRIDLQQHPYPQLQKHIQECEAKRGSPIELKPPKQQTSAVTEHQGLEPEAAERIDAWLDADTKSVPDDIVASLRRQHDAIAANNPGSSAHVKMNALLDAVEAYDKNPDLDSRERHKQEIRKKLAEAPRSGHAYDFGRSAEFLSTRQQLTQDFARWQNIYLFTDGEQRTAVARELVKEIYEGIPQDTAKDVTNLLLHSDDQQTTGERFRKLDATLQRQRDDESKDPEVRDRIGALQDSLRTWKRQWDAAPGAHSQAEIAARDAAWQRFKETPKRQHEAPDKWPKKGSMDPDSYYRQTAESWLKLGNFVGTDIYKTSGEIGHAWKQMSDTAKRTFERLAGDVNSGVKMSVPYSRRNVAKIVQEGDVEPRTIANRVTNCGNLAGGVMGGSAEYLAKNRRELLLSKETTDPRAALPAPPRQRADHKHVPQPAPTRPRDRSPSRSRSPG